jgi:hypothetical protein
MKRGGKELSDIKASWRKQKKRGKHFLRTQQLKTSSKKWKKKKKMEQSPV